MPNIFFNDSASLVAILFSALALVFSFWAFLQQRRISVLKKKFFQGSEGTNLEDALRILDKHLLDLQDQHLFLEKNFLTLKKEFRHAVQKIGIVKFNPFDNGGGNLSFVIALLDGENSGLLLTSMHGREHNRIYTKKVMRGKCEQQLTEEETAALQNANVNFLQDN